MLKRINLNWPKLPNRTMLLVTLIAVVTLIKSILDNNRQMGAISICLIAVVILATIKGVRK